jgi:hypothetical protein
MKTQLITISRLKYFWMLAAAFFNGLAFGRTHTIASLLIDSLLITLATFVIFGAPFILYADIQKLRKRKAAAAKHEQE